MRPAILPPLWQLPGVTQDVQTLTHPNLTGTLNFPHAPRQGGGRRERLHSASPEGAPQMHRQGGAGRAGWGSQGPSGQACTEIRRSWCGSCCPVWEKWTGSCPPSGSGLVEEEGLRKRMGKSRVGVLATAKGGGTCKVSLAAQILDFIRT